jgi:hypothetical protein
MISTEFFELAGLFVLADIVPIENPSIHRHIDAIGKRLHKCQGTAQVEQSI